MKKAILLFSAIAVLASCTKVLDKLGTFTFTRSSEVDIPSTTIVGVPITLSTPGISTSYTSEFSSNGFDTDNVEYIKVTQMKLRIKQPTSATFNFLKDINITIGADGLSDVQFASKMNIPNDNVSEIEMDVVSTDLKGYLMSDNFTMTASVETDEVITQDITVEFIPTFEVKANLLK